jgi:hypothetical protein
MLRAPVTTRCSAEPVTTRWWAEPATTRCPAAAVEAVIACSSEQAVEAGAPNHLVGADRTGHEVVAVGKAQLAAVVASTSADADPPPLRDHLTPTGPLECQGMHVVDRASPRGGG